MLKKIVEAVVLWLSAIVICYTMGVLVGLFIRGLMAAAGF